MAYLTLQEIEEEHSRLHKEIERTSASFFDASTKHPMFNSFPANLTPEYYAELARLKDEAGCNAAKDNLQSFHARRKEVFNAWCANPTLPPPGDDRITALNYVTSYIRDCAATECPLYTVEDASEIVSPKSLLELRRYAVLSPMAWWQRNSGRSWTPGYRRTNPSAKDEDENRKVAHVSPHDYIVKDTGDFEGMTTDFFEYYRAGVRFSLQAVLEDWFEPGDTDAFEKALGKNPAFLDAINTARTTESLFIELQKRMLPVNPSALNYARFRFENPNTKVIPANAKPRRGILVRSFIVSLGRSLTYGPLSASDTSRWQELNNWDVITLTDFSSRWITKPLLHGAADIAVNHRNWVSDLERFNVVEGHTQIRYVPPSNEEINKYLDEGFYAGLTSAQFTEWYISKISDVPGEELTVEQQKLADKTARRTAQNRYSTRKAQWRNKTNKKT